MELCFNLDCVSCLDVIILICSGLESSSHGTLQVNCSKNVPINDLSLNHNIRNKSSHDSVSSCAFWKKGEREKSYPICVCVSCISSSSPFSLFSPFVHGIFVQIRGRKRRIISRIEGTISSYLNGVKWSRSFFLLHVY